MVKQKKTKAPEIAGSKEYVFIEPAHFRRRRCVVLKFMPEDQPRFGMAFAQCSPTDQFTKKKGVAIARDRAEMVLLQFLKDGGIESHFKFSKAGIVAGPINGKSAASLAHTHGFLREHEQQMTREDHLEAVRKARTLKAMQDELTVLLAKADCPDFEKLPRLRA